LFFFLSKKKKKKKKKKRISAQSPLYNSKTIYNKPWYDPLQYYMCGIVMIHGYFHISFILHYPADDGVHHAHNPQLRTAPAAAPAAATPVVAAAPPAARDTGGYSSDEDGPVAMRRKLDRCAGLSHLLGLFFFFVCFLFLTGQVADHKSTSPS
jgi:hypothetical protein